VTASRPLGFFAYQIGRIEGASLPLQTTLSTHSKSLAFLAEAGFAVNSQIALESSVKEVAEFWPPYRGASARPRLRD